MPDDAEQQGWNVHQLDIAAEADNDPKEFSIDTDVSSLDVYWAEQQRHPNHTSRYPSMSREKWQALSESERKVWGSLSSKANSTILGMPPPFERLTSTVLTEFLDGMTASILERTLLAQSWHLPNLTAGTDDKQQRKTMEVGFTNKGI